MGPVLDLYEAELVADSISSEGIRLSSWKVTFPRLVLAEVNTHRVFSRNSASTRAIPLSHQIRNVMETPFIPLHFGVNKTGMQHERLLTGEKAQEAIENWLQGRDRAVTTALELVLGKKLAAQRFNYIPEREYIPGYVLMDRLEEIVRMIPTSKDIEYAERLNMLNVHKQLSGRPLETYMWQVAVISATEVDNFFSLRDHPDAQSEIGIAASLMRKAIANSSPALLGEGEWHLPFVEKGEFKNPIDAIHCSVARVAAISYRRHNAIHNLKNPTTEMIQEHIQKEIQRHNNHLNNRHFSPFEPQATPMTQKDIQWRKEMQEHAYQSGVRLGIDQLQIEHAVESDMFLGNFRGWKQYRKTIPGENNFRKLV